MSTVMLPCDVRWMIHRDCRSIGRWDWPFETLKAKLRQSSTRGNVAVHRGYVVGYMIYEVHARRFQLQRIAVKPDFRRQGVGTQLVDCLKRKRSTHYQFVEGAIYADVAERNLEAQLFFREVGFRARVVWHGADEDVYGFRYRRDES